METPNANKAPLDLVRCKVCGYVTEKDRIRNVCPACGVKAGMFEPHTENFSPKRRRFLSRHLHPIMVHMPQAFSFSLVVLILGMLSLSGPVKAIFEHAAFVMITAMPFVVAGSFLTGLLDGQIRFRRLSAPYLKIKFALGILYLGLALAIAIMVWATPWNVLPWIWIIGLLAAAQFMLTIILGKIGADIGCARMPG